MPTLGENKTIWNDTYDWHRAGEEWSDGWGTSWMQWHGTILPRIIRFLPANNILEIAPGYGRWTQYLIGVCDNITIVDLSEKCIKECKKRFLQCSHIRYCINDGKSLDMVQSDSIDFIFSFDSLVHVEDNIILNYIEQLPRILKKNGVAFIHHSNLGMYENSLKVFDVIGKTPAIMKALIRMKIVDDLSIQWRARSMTAEKMKNYTNQNGLECIAQELITWNTKYTLIDCISTIVRKESMLMRPGIMYKNYKFMDEAMYLKNLSRVYDNKPNN